MRVIIREAAYDDLDRIYSWIAKYIHGLQKTDHNRQIQ